MADHQATSAEPELKGEAPPGDTAEAGTPETSTPETGTPETGTDSTEVSAEEPETTSAPNDTASAESTTPAAEADRSEPEAGPVTSSEATGASEVSEVSEADTSAAPAAESTSATGADAPAPAAADTATPTETPEQPASTPDEPAVTPAPVAMTDAATTASPTRIEAAGKPRSKRTLVLAAMVVVLVALWVAGGFLLHQHRTTLRTEAAHQAALTAARDVATDLTSLGGADPQASIQRLQARTTGSFRDQVAQFNAAAQAMLQQNNAESRGAVTAAAIESGDTDHAVALVTVTQMISNNKLPSAQSVNLRLSIQLQREGDSWLASNVTYIP